MYCRFWVCELGWVESGPVSFRLWWGRLPPRQRSKLSRLRTDLPVEEWHGEWSQVNDE